MKKSFIRFTWICGGMLFAAVAVGAQTLRFNPPANQSFVVNSVSSRSQFVGKKLLGTDSTFSTVSSSIVRVKSGWEIREKITDFHMKRDSSTSDALLKKVMVGLNTTLKVDSVGEANAAEGFSQIDSRIQAISDTSAIRQLKEILNPDLMATKEVDEWNGRMSRLVGRSSKIGSMKHDLTEIQLPDDAELLLFELSFLLDTVKVNDRQCGLLMLYMDTNPIRLAKTTNRTLPQMAKLFEVTDSGLVQLATPPSDYRLTHEIIFDMQTLLVQSERSEREITLRQSNDPAQPVFSHLFETMQRVYTYTKR